MEYKPSDTPTDAGAQSALETRLPAMLTRLADGMPASVGLADRVERQLTANTGAIPHTARWRWGGVFGAPAWRQRAISAVGLVVVVALIAGFAVVLRAHQTSGRPAQQSTGCTSTATDADRGCIIHDATITITVLHTYADVVRTSLDVRYTVTTAGIPFGTPTRYGNVLMFEPLPNLEYAPGLALSFDSGSVDSGSTPGSFEQVLIYPALPASLMSGRHALTLTMSQIDVQDAAGHSALIVGQWSVPVSVTPQPSRAITFHVAPVTHSGVSMQPIALNVAPDAPEFDGLQGGAQLILRVSGLPSNMEISDIVDTFATQLTAPGGGGFTGTGGTLTLEGQLPAFVAIEVHNPQDTSSVVGPSGAVTLDITFTGPALPSLTGLQPLVIAQIGGQTNTITGPWDFQLPLS